MHTLDPTADVASLEGQLAQLNDDIANLQHAARLLCGKPRAAVLKQLMDLQEQAHDIRSTIAEQR